MARTLPRFATALAFFLLVGRDAAAVSVEIESVGPEVDAPRVKQAIENELARGGAASSSAHVSVRVEPEQVTVFYRAPSGSELVRSVGAPRRADELPELVALLVGNMASDGASALLDELERVPEPAPPPQAPPPRAPAAPEMGRERALAPSGINLSLWYPMTLWGNSEQRHFNFELGLFYSRIGGLSGAAVTPGVLRVDSAGSGASIAGIGHVHGGSGAGVRIGGLFGIAGGSFDGTAVAGAFLLQRGPVSGAQISGVTNIAAELSGAQIAGATNVVTGDVNGTQLGGAVNVAGALDGAQVGIVNVGGRVRGLQIGIVNVAGDVDGSQLGIVNVARDVDGVSLGVVPYVSRGRVQGVAWYDSKNLINVGVRFQNGIFYVMPTLSYATQGGNYDIEPEGASYAPGFSLGGRLALGRAFVDLDVNYSAPSDGWSYDEHSIDLRYRALAGYELARGIGLFAGGGVLHHFETKGPNESSVDPVLSAGIQLL